MVGNGSKHFGTHGRMVGHGVTAIYRCKGSASFDFFCRGGVDDSTNFSAMGLVSSMAHKLELSIPSIVRNGNIIPTLLKNQCPNFWQHFLNDWSLLSLQSRNGHLQNY